MVRRGIKAWALMLLPNLSLKSDEELKLALNTQSIKSQRGVRIKQPVLQLQAAFQRKGSTQFPVPSGKC